jgi:hypothetical protein
MFGYVVFILVPRTANDHCAIAGRIRCQLMTGWFPVLQHFYFSLALPSAAVFSPPDLPLLTGLPPRLMIKL